MRHLNIIAILFILCLDLTIGLIHVITQQIQIGCFHRCYRNVLKTEKSFVVSFETFVQIFQHQG